MFWKVTAFVVANCEADSPSNVVTIKGRINAWVEGECIIRLRPLLHCPSALTNPVIHKNWYINYLVLLINLKQPMMVFVQCAISRYVIHTRMFITQFKVQSCDQFWGVWFVEGHMSNTNYWLLHFCTLQAGHEYGIHNYQNLAFQTRPRVVNVGQQARWAQHALGAILKH